MAHAGTMDLGQSAKAARGGNPWLVVAVIVAIMAATVAAVWFTNRPATTSTALSARPTDQAYAQIEAWRAAVTSTAHSARPTDDDYYQIENWRAVVTAPAVVRSVDKVSSLRMAAGRGPLVGDTFGKVQPAPIGTSLTIEGDQAFNPREQLQGGSAIISGHRLDPIEQLGLGGAVAAPATSSPEIGLADYGYAQIRKLQAAAGNGPSRFDAYDLYEKIRDGYVPIVLPSAVVVGPGDYGFEQFSQMAGATTAPTVSMTSGTFHAGSAGAATGTVTVKRDRVGGP